MKDRWRAEDGYRDRHPRSRERSRDRWHRSPSPPRYPAESSHRGRDLFDIDYYRPRDPSRDSRYAYNSRRSPSPRFGSRPPSSHAPRHRAYDDRIAYHRELSPPRPPKRRRTRSPSPARSDRWAPEGRRTSPNRDRPVAKDKWAPVDRAFSPRRSSPTRVSRIDSRDPPPEIDSYTPHPRGRDRTPPKRREQRPLSPPRRPRTPPRRKEAPLFRREDSRSPVRQQIPRRDEAQPTSFTERDRTPPRPGSVRGEGEEASMDPRYATQGYHGNRGNYMPRGGQQRPWVDTRYQQSGSPHSGTPNTSHHGSPYSSSHQNRPGWAPPLHAPSG